MERALADGERLVTDVEVLKELLHRLAAPGVVATDLDTEHGGTDANKRDGARQLGRLNVDDLQL